MTSSTRKKLLIGAGAGLAVLIAALLVAPSFVDLNTYKPQIVAEVKKATGRKLELTNVRAVAGQGAVQGTRDFFDRLTLNRPSQR